MYREGEILRRHRRDVFPKEIDSRVLGIKLKLHNRRINLLHCFNAA